MIQKINNYPKIRLLLAVLLSVIWGMLFTQAYFMGGFTYINWKPVSFFLIGSLLFTLNKVRADIISFLTFLFGLSYIFIDYYKSYVSFESKETFLNFLIWQLSMNKFEIFGLTIFFIASIYLLTTFYKKRSLGIYK